jgi:hypothetical protein
MTPLGFEVRDLPGFSAVPEPHSPPPTLLTPSAILLPSDNNKYTAATTDTEITNMMQQCIKI